jgi:hypothetical protein
MTKANTINYIARVPTNVAPTSNFSTLILQNPGSQHIPDIHPAAEKRIVERLDDLIKHTDLIAEIFNEAYKIEPPLSEEAKGTIEKTKTQIYTKIKDSLFKAKQAIQNKGLSIKDINEFAEHSSFATEKSLLMVKAIKTLLSDLETEDPDRKVTLDWERNIYAKAGLALGALANLIQISTEWFLKENKLLKYIKQPSIAPDFNTMI